MNDDTAFFKWQQLPGMGLKLRLVIHILRLALGTIVRDVSASPIYCMQIWSNLTL